MFMKDVMDIKNISGITEFYAYLSILFFVDIIQFYFNTLRCILCRMFYKYFFVLFKFSP